jgi:hypothetical protein
MGTIIGSVLERGFCVRKRSQIPNLVDQELERREGLRSALVLEQHVEERPLSGNLHRIEQVRVAISVLRIHDTARHQRQCLPVDLRYDGRWQEIAQLRGRVAGL